MEPKVHDTNGHKNRTRSVVYCGMFTVFIAICSYISLPIVIPVTLQTFAIFLLLFLLGGKKGSICILIYLLLGACGLPVFHGMTGGIGILLGNTGGYLFGFLMIGLVYWLLTTLFHKQSRMKIPALICGLIGCYTIGTLWFAVFYVEDITTGSIFGILSTCVIPFLFPDFLKLVLALFVSSLIRKALPNEFLTD